MTALLFKLKPSRAARADRLTAAEEQHPRRFRGRAGGRWNHRAPPVEVGPELGILAAHGAAELKRMFRNVEQNAAAVALEMRIFAAVGRIDLRAIEVDEHGRGARECVTEVEDAAAAQQRARR